MAGVSIKFLRASGERRERLSLGPDVHLLTPLGWLCVRMDVSAVCVPPRNTGCPRLPGPMVATRLAGHRLWRLRRRPGPHQLGACPADRLTGQRNSFLVPNRESEEHYKMLLNNLVPLEGYAKTLQLATVNCSPLHSQKKIVNNVEIGIRTL